MTDPATTPPIVVNADPVKDQGEAGFRQLLSLLGLLLPLVGLAKWAGVLGWVVNNADTVWSAGMGVIGLGAIVWGQIKTRVLSKKAAALAKLLPDTLAVTK